MTITINIYKRYFLVLTPTEWFIWPVWNRDWNHTYKAKQIEAAFDSDETGKQGQQYVVLAVKTDLYIKFLFFDLHFPWWKTNKDAASIYPANYKWQDDPDYNKKYQALIETEYFS